MHEVFVFSVNESSKKKKKNLMTKTQSGSASPRLALFIFSLFVMYHIIKDTL